jgi:hypothetical protein
MTPVAVIERVTILSGMTGKTGLLFAVISKHNLCDTLLEWKKREMTTAAFKFSRMGLMVKRDRLLTVTEKNNLLGSRGFHMATAAVIPGERLLAVMADEAIFLLSMIRLGNFVCAFLYFEQPGMAVAAFCYLRMDLMIKSDLSLCLPEGFRCRIHGYVTSLLQSLDADMTAGALGIGGKGVLPVMARAAILALIERFHVKILLFLNLQGFHFKKPAMAPNAGKALINPVRFMGKENGFHRYGIENPPSIHRIPLGRAIRGRGMDQRKCNQRDEISFHGLT